MGHKVDEILDLDFRGLAMQFSYPLYPKKSPDREVLHSMMETAEAAGSPYLLTEVENGFYTGRVILWKERKSLRCNKCKAFLNARPQKYKPSLTHKHVGRMCADTRG
jgi:hypothetical protein